MLMTLDVGRLSADQRTSGTWVLLTSKWVEVMVGASTGGAPSGSLSC